MSSQWLRSRGKLATSCPVAMLALVSLVLFGTARHANGQSFSLDDNPSAPLGSPAGTFPGFGAEDEFGTSAGPGLAPSPSIGASVFPGAGDGTLFSGSLGGLQMAPNGGYIDAFSRNHLQTSENIHLGFSVDRLTPGVAGSAVAGQAALSQQPGDIFLSTATFTSPAAFVGTAGAAPYGGLLPTAGSAPGGSNVLLIDESTFGLTTAAGIVGPAASGGSFTLGSHDNVDAFDAAPQFASTPPPTGVYTIDTYYAVSPDEAAATGTSAADLFAVPAGATAGFGPYALAGLMGLDSVAVGAANTDSIDALVMFDIDNTPSDGALVVQSGIDFALFSLAPGSASLAPGALTAAGLSADEVFFTDFTGKFFTYALPGDVGLFPGGMFGNSGNNIDALEVETQIPEPSTLVAVLGGLAALLFLAPRRPR